MKPEKELKAKIAAYCNARKIDPNLVTVTITPQQDENLSIHFESAAVATGRNAHMAFLDVVSSLGATMAQSRYSLTGTYDSLNARLNRAIEKVSGDRGTGLLN